MAKAAGDGGGTPTIAIARRRPESVARENLVLPLDLRGRTLLVATTEPHNFDTAQKLEFILNKDIVLVNAAPDEVLETINRLYGQSETVSVDSVSYESPLVGLGGDEVSGYLYGVFHTAFSVGWRGGSCRSRFAGVRRRSRRTSAPCSFPAGPGSV